MCPLCPKSQARFYSQGAANVPALPALWGLTSFCGIVPQQKACDVWIWRFKKYPLSWCLHSAQPFCSLTPSSARAPPAPPSPLCRLLTGAGTPPSSAKPQRSVRDKDQKIAPELPSCFSKNCRLSVYTLALRRGLFKHIQTAQRGGRQALGLCSFLPSKRVAYGLFKDSTEGYT